jgi:hypothetical protein
MCSHKVYVLSLKTFPYLIRFSFLLLTSYCCCKKLKSERDLVLLWHVAVLSWIQKYGTSLPSINKILKENLVGHTNLVVLLAAENFKQIDCGFKIAHIIRRKES